MKRIFIAVFLLLLLTACGGKTEQELIKENFYQAYSGYNVIENGVYIVEKDGLFAIINSETGEVYSDFLYDRMEKISNEKILAAKSGQYSIISPKGKEICQLGNYGNVRLYYNDDTPRFLTYNDGYYTLLDENGETIGDYGTFDHLELNTVTNDRFVIQRGTLYTVINEKGNQIANLGRYDELVPEFENDSYIVTRSGKKGVINHRGAAIIQLKYDNIWKLNKNTCYVLNSGDKFGAASIKGKIVLPVEFDGVEGYENVLVASKDGYYGVFGTDGREYAACEYNEPYEVKETDGVFKCKLTKDKKVFEITADGEQFNLIEK